MAKRRTSKGHTRSRARKEITKPCSPLFIEAVREVETAANVALQRRLGELVELELKQQGLERTQWAIDLKRGIWIQRTGA